jgi:UDP-N-acetylglucosamine 2-epimerase (non-hydrolysing)
MVHILITFGTRPEYLKVNLLYKELIQSNIPAQLLYISQHTDLINDLQYDYKLEIENYNNNRLDSIIMSILHKFDQIISKIKFDYVLIQGDTASSYAVALASYHRKIKLIHLEAGLRTYDKENPYPEDVYRRFISTVSDIHLCPTEVNKNNLFHEGITQNVYVVGNTIIDQIKKYNYITKYNNKVLVTLHRRENWDLIPIYFEQLEKIASQYQNLEFIYPMHANEIIKKHCHLLKSVQVIHPLPHRDLCQLLAECRLIITDSGGQQEEAAYFGKKVICCRQKTERVEVLGTHCLLCLEPQHLSFLFDQYINDYQAEPSIVYGDGTTIEKIIKILKF